MLMQMSIWMQILTLDQIPTDDANYGQNRVQIHLGPLDRVCTLGQPQTQAISSANCLAYNTLPNPSLPVSQPTARSPLRRGRPSLPGNSLRISTPTKLTNKPKTNKPKTNKPKNNAGSRSSTISRWLGDWVQLGGCMSWSGGGWVSATRFMRKVGSGGRERGKGAGTCCCEQDGVGVTGRPGCGL